MPIRFHLQKISKRSLICSFKLPNNHILKNLLNDDPPSVKLSNPHNIRSLTNCQKSLIKDHLPDSHTKTLGIFPLFFPIDPEFSSGNRITDIFSNCFSFNLVNKKVKNHNKIRGQELDEIVLRYFLDFQTALITTDASIKNDIATSISHIHSYNRPLVKTIHHTSFVISIETELFTIRYGINQACIINNVSKIIVVTDSIHAAKKIFNSGLYPYQIYSATILSELYTFFSSNESNIIEFWECPSKLR